MRQKVALNSFFCKLTIDKSGFRRYNNQAASNAGVLEW